MPQPVTHWEVQRRCRNLKLETLKQDVNLRTFILLIDLIFKLRSKSWSGSRPARVQGMARAACWELGRPRFFGLVRFLSVVLGEREFRRRPFCMVYTSVYEYMRVLKCLFGE